MLLEKANRLRSLTLSLVFTLSIKLDNRSFHVADLPKTWKKCTKMKNARAERAKLLFLLIINMQILRRFRCRRVVDLKLPVNIYWSTALTSIHMFPTSFPGLLVVKSPGNEVAMSPLTMSILRVRLIDLTLSNTRRFTRQWGPLQGWMG